MDPKQDDPHSETGAPKGESGAGHVDLNKVLLPKKDTPGRTVDSAQRINAGALLEQEQKATLQASAPTAPAKPAAAPPPQKKPEDPMIAPLQTFKGDIESLIQNTNASTVSIAAAEAARRAQAPLTAAAEAKPFDWQGLVKRMEMIIGGVFFLLVAAGILYFAYNYLRATVPVAQDEPAPFITVDATEPVVLPGGVLQRPTIMAALEAARQSDPLSLGLIERLAVHHTVPGSEQDTYVQLNAQELLPSLAPNMPDTLVRTLTGTYLLGVHTYEGVQAILILEVDSYERGFAGMLDWERNMRSDLLPLFNYEPRERIPEEGVATSSVGSVPQLLQTGFSDKIVANRDTRVVQNTASDILFLWTPLTPNLFIITTNEYTLREVISRLGL